MNNFSLIEHLQYRDELFYITSCIDEDALFPFALTCNAAKNAVRALKTPIETTYASLVSSVGLIKWAIDMDCPLNGKIWLEEAALEGHLDVVRWLCDTLKCDWNTCDAAENAAGNGHLHILEWASQDTEKDLTWIYSCAALCGHLNIIQWATNKKIVVGEFGDTGDMACVLNAAAEGGHRETLDWLRNNGFKWDSFTIAGAAKGGHLEIVKWLRTEGCDWSANVYVQAAKYGHLEIIKWAHANGLSLGRFDLSGYAAKRGNREILEWVRENEFR
jgi:hypothetical protein